MKLLTISCFVAGLALASPALAEPAITFTGGTPTGAFPDRTLGYEFTTNSSITIGSLGYWDMGGDGLLESHEVGIWSADGLTLIASAIIPGGTGGELDGEFRFVSITPIILDASTSYLIGGFTGDAGDFVTRFTTATTIPEITLGSTRFDNGPPFAGVFTAPTGTQGTGFDFGYFGPNFRLFAAVPEPSTWAMMLIGFGAVGFAMRRRRQTELTIRPAA